MMPYIAEGALHVLNRKGALEKLAARFPECQDDRLKSDVYRLAFYLRQREKGVQHVWAMMSATQQAARAMTDRELFAGVGTLDKQFEPEYLSRLIAAAKRNGYTPSPHDIYMPSLANEIGDPEAFVPPTGGRNHIRRVCEKRGLACEGAVKVAGRSPEREPDNIRLAPDIVDREVASMVRKNPALAGVSRKDLASEVVSKHGAKK